MAWVYLDDKFHSNPKVLEMGNSGAGLYARALSYCGDHLTDGFVPQSWAKSAASKALREKLVVCGAWDVVPGGYFIPDYLKLNPSKEKVLEKRAKRSAAGAKGAESRWGDGKPNGKSDGICHTESHAFATDMCMHPSPTPTPSPSISLVSPTRDVGPLEGALNNYALIVRLIAACGGGDTVREKVERTVRKWRPSEYDLSETIRAATGPGVRDALSVALSELKKRGEARAA